MPAIGDKIVRGGFPYVYVGFGKWESDKAIQGTSGLSAYEIWLAEGNTGSEQDFLDSLNPVSEGLGTNNIPYWDGTKFSNSTVFKDGASIKIGTSANNVEFKPDGTVKLNGSATIYDDVTYDAISLQETGPGVSVNKTESSVDYISTANNLDYMMANPQMPHAREIGSKIYPHIHFWQASNAVPNFALQYRWQVNGGTKTTAWTAIKCNTLAFTYVTGTLNQIAKVETGIVAPLGDNISDIVQFRIIRDTTNALGLAYGADPYVGTVSVVQFDVHVVKDSLGSAEEYVKEYVTTTTTTAAPIL